MGGLIYFKPDVDTEGIWNFLQPKPKTRLLQNLIDKAEKRQAERELEVTTTTLPEEDLCDVVYELYGKDFSHYYGEHGYCYYNEDINIPFCIRKRC
jgi:hypothetical protein